jgi:hypothetical protein
MPKDIVISTGYEIRKTEPQMSKTGMNYTQ